MKPFNSVSETIAWFRSLVKTVGGRPTGVLVDFGEGIGVQRREIFYNQRDGWVLGFPEVRR